MLESLEQPEADFEPILEELPDTKNKSSAVPPSEVVSGFTSV